MEVKRICQWCGKPFMAKKTTTNYCSPQCSKRGYKHRMKERRMEMREFQEMLEVKNKLESQEYFTFSQAARLMGVSRQYVYKLVKRTNFVHQVKFKNVAHQKSRHRTYAENKTL